ncbi:MAG: radical SAM protein [Elusimicrobia bacterium]|nr:radical SAM protein [Elusimicrobiota bacterium]
MKILLMNPPFKPQYGKFSREQRSPAITKSGTFYYPMWLAYATGLLEKNGHECILLDAPAERIDYNECILRLDGFKPDLIVVDTSTPSIYNDVSIAADLKKRYGAFVVLVGPHPSALPEDTLRIDENVDAVAMREYDYILVNLAALLEARSGQPSKEDLLGIKGIAFRKKSEIIVNEKAEMPQDLDSIPFVSSVYKKHLNYKNYFYAHSKYPIVTIVSGRGCPHQCIYCVYPQVFNGRRVRNRSIKNVVDEMEYIIKNFPEIKEIMFEDDTLTLDKKRCIELSEEILKRGIKIEWSANSRADVDLDTMYALKRAGARLFCVGIESGDQEVLDSMKKNLKIERVKQFFIDSKKAGIKIHGCFLVGNPKETKETLEKTLSLALTLEPDTAQFFPIMAYPGTEIYDWAYKNGYLKTTDYSKWLDDCGMHNSVMSRPELTDRDLVSFCDKARKRFYLRVSYISKKFLQGLFDSYEMKRLVKGGVNLLKTYLIK